MSASVASNTICTTSITSSSIDAGKLRTLFPIFSHAADVIYFDNASTTQKPTTVLQAMEKFYNTSCANAGRASYQWSTLASQQIEETRDALAKFINANSENIIFTAGATDSLNTIALAWGLENLQDGDEIMLCPEDHKSAILPWYNVQRILAKQGKNIAIKTFKIHTVGDYDLKTIKEAVSNKTKLLAMSHIHHVYGLDMEVPEIRKIVGDQVIISLDACQSIGHCQIDVKHLNVNFISFSAHKMFGPNGIGALWINPKLTKEIIPFKLGGKANANIDFSAEGSHQLSFDQNNLPSLLEAGTLNIPAIIGWKPAIELIESLGVANIQNHTGYLLKLLYLALKALPGIDFAPGPGVCGCPDGSSIIAFRFEHIPTMDLAFMLDSENIYVRSGDHCMGIAKASEGDAYIRVSLHAYNTEAEVKHFIEVLTQALT
jgi:cysteine desulfurase/selenocysteine lyase